MRLEFPDSFFKGEEIEGFFVEEKMKHAWAAQLQVLVEFDEVCSENNLTWYAAYGTMIGAVRHKGFIPWDDDLDVHMPRADYDRFVRLAPKILPKGYYALNFHVDPDYEDYITRVVNHQSIDYRPENLEHYHGCPYAVGLDVSPIDYLPRDPQEFELYKTITGFLGGVAGLFVGQQLSRDEERQLLSQVEKLTRAKIDRGRPIPQQIRILCDKYCGMYRRKDGDMMGVGIRQHRWENYFMPRECFEEIIRLPFENIEINVPGGYDTILSRMYGDYMTPRVAPSHDYPFYKKQDEEYARQLEEARAKTAKQGE